jgi:hypothetical protein
MFADTSGDQEALPFRPTVAVLGKPDLLLAEWLAMGGGRVLPVGGAVPDMAVQDDQRGPPLGGLED